MNIKIIETGADPTQIQICCHHKNGQITNLAEYISRYEHKIGGQKDGSWHQIEEQAILYIETVEDRTFLYTKEAVYETESRLYELENMLDSSSFFRSSRSMILNLRQVQKLQPELNRSITAIMKTGKW